MRLIAEVLLFLAIFLGWMVADFTLRATRTNSAPRRTIDPSRRGVPFSTCTDCDEVERRGRYTEYEEELFALEVVQDLIVVLSSLLISLSWLTCLSIMMNGRRLFQMQHQALANMAAESAFEVSRRQG